MLSRTVHVEALFQKYIQEAFLHKDCQQWVNGVVFWEAVAVATAASGEVCTSLQ